MRVVRRGATGFALLLTPGFAHHFVVLAVRAYGAWKCVRERPEPPDTLARITYMRTRSEP